MKIAFHGAARTVTGSKHLITLKNGNKILLDCGMFQGMGKDTDSYNRTFGFNPEEVMLVEKFDPARVITAVYLDNDKEQYNVKRFRIETTTMKSKFLFIKEGKGNLLEAVSTEIEPLLIVQSGKGAQVRRAKFKLARMVDVMGWKAVGAKLVDWDKSVQMEWETTETTQPELF